MKKLYYLLFALSFFSFFVNQKNLAQTYAPLPFNEQFEGAWVNKDATRDVPSLNWKNTPATTDSSWSRDDDGAARGAWGSLSGAYSPSGAAFSKHSARFHSYSVPAKNKGALDLFINCSGYADAKTLTFWYINQNGYDSLKVYFSNNGGASFGEPIKKLRYSIGGWEKIVVSLGTTTSATCVIRFEGVGDSYWWDDLAIDNISVSTPTTPFTVDFFATKLTGMAPFTIQFADTSSVDLTARAWDFDNNGSIDATTQFPRYTFPSAGTYTVKLTGTKGASSLATTKNTYITIAPQVYASLPFSEDFEDYWINRDTLWDVPSSYFRSEYPAKFYNTWRRNDGLYWGNYQPEGALNTNHSASFNSFNSYKSGYLDLHLNLSTQTGAKTLSFWYLNIDGNDSLEVFLSTDGVNFGNDALTVQKISTSWSYVKVALGNVNSTTGIIRFMAHGDQGSTNIGLDEIHIESPSASPVKADYISSTSYGVGSLTVNFTDISSGAPTNWGWDFDNNGTVDETTQNPSHIYSNPGVYSVKFTASKTGSTETITKSSSIFVGTYASLPLFENFESAWINRGATRDVPSLYAASDPSLGNNSWSRDDDGYARGAWSSMSGPYTPAGANGTGHSARFHSYYASSNTAGILDYYVNFSTLTGNKVLTFWYINKTGTDYLEVYLSQDNGAHYNILNTQMLATDWTKISIDLGNITSNKGIIRFKAISDYGNSDIGIDEISIDIPVDAQFIANKITGVYPLEVSFTDQSAGSPTEWSWDFDNNGTIDATTQNPSFTYSQAGTYAVKLIASKLGFSDTEVKTAYINVSAPVDAAFSANVTDGVAPMLVKFTDQSTGTPTAWAWDFNNDGTIDATTKNPSYTYPAAGTYTVKLVASKTGSSDTETKTSYITVVPPVEAAFSASTTTGPASLLVNFTDQSTGTPAAWAWDFNSDGTVDATTQNPSYTYPAAGVYTVKLVASKTGSSDTEIKSKYITVLVADGAEFTANTLSGAAPLLVNFTDLSAGSTTSWEWDFDNDGTVDDASQNPSFTYSSAGTYTVKLVVSKTGSSDTETKMAYITVTNPVEPVDAVFSANTTSGIAPLQVNFTDESTGTPTAWEWDFDNDGTVDATTQNPSFTYPSAGIYTVKLVASKAGSSDTETKTEYITVFAPVEAAFTAITTSGVAPLLVNFTDESTGTPTAWEWDFDNDGTVDATTQNPSFTYPSAGNYTVKLVASKTGSSDTETKTAYITVSAAVEAAFTASTTSGSAPLLVNFTDQSTGTPTAWEWDFNNDGTVDATTQNPSFTYSASGTYTVKLVASKTGSSDTETKTGYITVSPATGISDNDKQVSAEVYPNPSSGKVYIRFAQNMEKEKVSVFLLDGNGKMLKVLETENQDLFELDLTGYAPGVYFVKVVGKDELLNKKLIIQ